jgi:hypothetical protein
MRGVRLGPGGMKNNEVVSRRLLHHPGFTGRRWLWWWPDVKLLVCIALLTTVVVPGRVAMAQATSATKDVGTTSIFSAPARSWAVDAASNELVALHHKGSYLRYRMRTVNEKGDQVRDVIESKDGTVARLTMKDRRPLTEEQDKWERQRLNDMLASPSTYFKHVRNGETERRMADRLVPLMPDAALYSYAPGQPQTGTNGGALEVVIDYKPNPNFTPPNTEAEALTGLEGRIWIDAKTHYLVRMEGTVSHAVNFGWGMLAHIYPGGKLVLNQTDAGGNRWIFTDFSMELSVRALMVKNLNVKSHVEASDYQTITPMSYQDAIHLLLDTPLPGR